MGILLDGTAGGGMSGGFILVAYVVLIFGFVYFMTIRPLKKSPIVQQKVTLRFIT